MNHRRPHRITFPALRGAIVAFAALGAILGAAVPAPAQGIVALVNGDPITEYDVDQRMRMTEAFLQRKPTRKETLEELIDERVKINEARRLNVNIPESQIDRTFAGMAQQTGRSAADFAEAFKQANIDVRTFRSKLRADIVWRDVLAMHAPGKFHVRDADVVAALVARGEQPTAKAMQYTMRQFVFIVPRSAPPAQRAARLKEAESFRAKVTSCEEAIQLAREIPELVTKDPVSRISSDLPPRLQKLLEETQDGRLTPPESTAAGIEVVAVCGRRATIADLSSRTEVKNQLLANSMQSSEKELLEKLRRKAIIQYR